MVPEKMITFVFVLCQPCADAGHGEIAHLYKEPDDVFWQRVRDAQLEETKKNLGVERFLTPEELVHRLDDPTTTMSKLADEWLNYVLKKAG
jgi:ABC-type sugar transport system substrate-binding protein